MGTKVHEEWRNHSWPCMAMQKWGNEREGHLQGDRGCGVEREMGARTG